MQETTQIFQSHPLCWFASIFCCLSVFALAYLPVKSALPIYQSHTFLPTYSVGIFSWLLHGIDIHSKPIIVTCTLQCIVLIFLLKRAYLLRVSNHKDIH